ncbi:1-acyl-sn-glycerol-3-phosphate acyltransferase [Lentisalinibacter salinarum]|uniref:1-acyl-sn-glycerol-3-phosphate acyltransferase n=1 Tax=Lentisalinibacter salinarum TaxID=2992239 RepID=UPI00386853ED
MTESRQRLEQALRELAPRIDRDPAALSEEAEGYLAELDSRRGATGVGLFAALSRFICRRGYARDIVCDEGEFVRVANLARRGPVVYLITHKTYLDIFALYHALHERGIDTPYVFGGINMDFLGLGWLSRRAGGIFIRRGIRDNPVYRLALKTAIGDLLSAGASFMWAIEGTRSRTGKLVMPKLGLLKYVVEASRELDGDPVRYLPVSIAYDQIPDVPEMTAQQTGAGKAPESLSWFVRYVRGLRQPLGRIYVRFGEPVSLHDTPDAPALESASAESMEVQKLAFEVCYRINRVTPPTTVSLVMMSLLCEEGLGRARLRDDVIALFGHVRRHDPEAVKALPAGPDAELDRVLAELAATGMVVESAGRLTVPRERHLAALYYSNMAAHHFVIAAFVELALLRVAEADGAEPRRVFEDEIDRLRDLFKMEFFFARRREYRAAVRAELEALTPDWESRLEAGGAGMIAGLLGGNPLCVAQAVLRPYVEAYRVVARALLSGAADPDPGDDALIETCLGLGRRMADRRDIRWADSASRALVAGGLLLVRNRGLIADGGGVERRRREFDVRLTDLYHRLERLSKL